MEELIYGGKVSKSIGLALLLELNLPFLLCSTLYLSAIFQAQAPGGLIFGGAIKQRVFFHYRFGGLIFGGAYCRHFTVVYAYKKEEPSDQSKREKTITMANKDKT